MSEGPGPGARGRAWLVVCGCLAAQMGLGCVYVFGPLLKDIVSELGWGRGEFSAASGIRTVTIACASPLVGWLTWRFGARAVLAGALLLLGVTFALYSGMRELWQLWLLSAGVGLVIAGVGDIAVGTVVAKWVAGARGLALGIVYSGSNLGGVLAAFAATRIATATGSWRDAVLWVGLGAVVLFLPAVLATVREPPPGLASPSEPGGDVGEGATLGEAVRTPSFWLLGGALVLFYFYYIGVNAHLSAFLMDQGLSRTQAGDSFAMSVLLGVASKLGIGLFADRWPARAALLLCFGVVTGASFLLLAVPAPGLLPLFLVAHGLSVAAQNVVYPLCVASVFGTRHMAQIYGVLMLALLPGGYLGPIFAGLVFDETGSYTLAFRVFAAGNLAALLALALVRSAPRTEAAAS